MNLTLDHLDSELLELDRIYRVPSTWGEFEEWAHAHEEAAERLRSDYVDHRGAELIEEACDPRANPEANARRFLDWVGKQWREAWSQ